MKTHYSWMLRTYLTGSIATTAAVALIDPSSQHANALQTWHPAGEVAVAIIIVILALGAIDLILNDYMPGLIRARWVTITHEYRHLGFLALMACQLGMMYASWKMQGMQPVLIRYGLDALAACFIAIWGVWQHWTNIQCAPSESVE